MTLRAKDLLDVDDHDTFMGHEAFQIEVNNRGLQLFTWIYEWFGKFYKYKRSSWHSSSTLQFVKAIKFLRLCNCHFLSQVINNHSDRHELYCEILRLMECILLTICRRKPDLSQTKISMLLEIFLGTAATPYLKDNTPDLETCSYTFPSFFLDHWIDFREPDWYTAARGNSILTQFEPSQVDTNLLDNLLGALVLRFNSHLIVGLGGHHRKAIDLLR